MPSSTSFSACHIDWRPSRWLQVALIALGLLAGVSVWLSQAPAWLSLPAAVAAAVYGLALAQQHRAKPALSVDWLGGDEPAYLTGPQGVVGLQDVRVQLRGPFATMTGRLAGGQRQRVSWWPDTLRPCDRRQLRLAAPVSRRCANPLPEQAA